MKKTYQDDVISQNIRDVAILTSAGYSIDAVSDTLLSLYPLSDAIIIATLGIELQTAMYDNLMRLAKTIPAVVAKLM